MKLFTVEEECLFDKASRNIDNILMFLICTISSMAIYASDTTLSTKLVQNALVVFIYLSISFVGLRVFLKNKFKFSLVLISPLVYVILCYINSPSPRFNLLLLVDLLLFASLTDDSKTYIFLLFKKYLVVTSALGIIAYICYMVSIPIPHETKAYYSEFTSSVYIDYHFSYLVVAMPFVRLCGLFNEPGYLGTIIAFVLCSDNMNLKKKENLVLFIAAFLTFSMAFYAIILIYMIFKSGRSKSFTIALLVVYILFVYVLPDLDLGANMNKLIGRFSFSDGQFAGDNRSRDVVDVELDYIMNSDRKLWGYGQGYASSLESEASSYKLFLLNHGILGFVFVYGSLLLTTLTYAKGNRNILLYLLCFYVSIYQRPNIFNLTYFVVLLGGISYINKQTELGQNRIQ